MKKLVVPFGWVLLGALLASLINSQLAEQATEAQRDSSLQSQVSNPTSEAPAPPNGENSGELQKLLTKIDRQAQRILALEEDLRLANRQYEERIQAEKARQEERQRFQKEQQEAFLARRLEDFSSRLNLDESQKQKVAEIFRRRWQDFAQGSSRPPTPSFDMDAAMREVLTEEQFNAYLEQSQEIIFARASNIADSQIARLRRNLQITPEKEAPLYESLHITLQEMMMAHQTGQDYDYNHALELRLSEVLDQDELENYRQNPLRAPRPGQGLGRRPGVGP